MHDNGPKQNTQQPIVTGTSVVALKFKDGVVIAADNLGASSLPHPDEGTHFNLLQQTRLTQL
jgi:20S proteasome alpha/beta subunit